MKLRPQLTHLVAEFLAFTPRARLAVVPSIEQVLISWAPSTRFSPLFCVDGVPQESPEAFDFQNSYAVVLLGPVHPAAFLAACPSSSKTWLSLGTLNCIAAVDSAEDARALARFADSEGLAVETWLVDGGTIKVSRKGAEPIAEADPAFLAELGRIIGARHVVELKGAAAEYCPLFASLHTRSAQCLPDALPALDKTHAALKNLLNPDTETEHSQRKKAVLTFTNAALSRLSSQLFAGTPPVRERECHCWNHSLLGLGVPTLALSKLRDSVEYLLAQKRIVERFQRYESVSDPQKFRDLREVRPRDPYWYHDHLDAIGVPPPAELGPIVPLIPYFTGRDGFRSTPTTLGVPLATVAACNSVKWTLMTMTHEISHTIVKGVLAVILPDLESLESLAKSLALINLEGKASNLLDEIRRRVLLSMCAMQRAYSRNTAEVPHDEEGVADLVEDWAHDVEEVLVHCFDFHYFYGTEAKRYIPAIWFSWSVIPSIRSRVREYVVRTICSLLSLYLRRPGDTPEVEAHKEAIKILSALSASASGDVLTASTRRAR